MPAREMLLHLACMLSGLGVVLAGAGLCSTCHAAHAVCGGILFALGAAGVGLQGWHAVKRLRAEKGRRKGGGRGEAPGRLPVPLPCSPFFTPPPVVDSTYSFGRPEAMPCQDPLAPQVPPH
jgi:hypothetical protein